MRARGVGRRETGGVVGVRGGGGVGGGCVVEAEAELEVDAIVAEGEEAGFEWAVGKGVVEEI